MEQTIQFTLNGRAVSVEVDARRPLLWVLRSDLALTGTKHGCDKGYCGACMILVDGGAERSCLLRIGDVAGRNVTTIEGLADDEELHPIQQAFADHDALQCGYCTPGMILASHDLLRKNPQPSEAEIINALEHNFCRCGAHKRIIEAVQSAAGAMRS